MILAIRRLDMPIGGKKDLWLWLWSENKPLFIVWVIAIGWAIMLLGILAFAFVGWLLK